MSQVSPVQVVNQLAKDWTTHRNSTRGWPQFLQSLSIRGLRGWSGEEIEFRFPVVAIAGENGSGKSTVLKTAACAYRARETHGTATTKTFYPDDFFPRTPWEEVRGVIVDVWTRQGPEFFHVTLRKKSERWRGMPGRPERNVFFLDISRIQPIDTLIGYGKIAKAATSRGEEVALSDASRSILARVMGRSYEKGSIVTQDRKPVGVLKHSGNTYSNFHQGAGEDATTDLVALLATIPRGSLIIIDEVEASLHPRAQRRLMTELLILAKEKRLQLILSTHSPYILEQLPAEARIYIQSVRHGPKEVIYGITPQFALSLMDDQSHPELTVYVEDDRAAEIFDRMVSIHKPSLRSRMKILAVGPASVVRVLGEATKEGRLDLPAIGVLDPDQNASDGCLVLPGAGCPEQSIFDNLSEVEWTEVSKRLGVQPAKMLEAVEDAKRLENPHSWPRRAAEKLGPRVQQDRLWQDAVAVWVDTRRQNPDHMAFMGGVEHLFS